MPKKNTDEIYKARYNSIKSYVNFSIPKKLDKNTRQKITKTYNAIAKIMLSGAVVVRSRSKKRVQLANKLAKIKNKNLKVAFSRNSPVGAKISIDPSGNVVEKIGSIKRMTIYATFFIFEMPNAEKNAEREAKRIVSLTRGAKFYCVKYRMGGESSGFAHVFLRDRLLVSSDYGDSGQNIMAEPVAIVATWTPRSSIKVVEEIKNKQAEKRKKAKKRWGKS